MKLENIPYRIIKVVQENIQYLLKNTNQLAWCLLCYELSHSAVRMSGTDTDNPKYIFLDDQEKDWPGLSKEELDIVYNAWGVTVSNYISEDFPFSERYHNNMTLDEWEEYLQSEDYRYKDLYDNDFFVSNQLLCVIGTEYEWNKDGFIFDSTINDKYIGYSQAEKDVPSSIKNKIFKICEEEKIASHFKNLYDIAVEYNKLSGSQKRKLSKQIYPLGKFRFFHESEMKWKDTDVGVLDHLLLVVKKAKKDIYIPKVKFLL